MNINSLLKMPKIDLTRVPKMTTGEISILLMILQSCGIRYFSGIGIFFLILIFLLNYRSVFYLEKRDGYILISALSLIFLFSIGYSPKEFILQSFAFIDAMLLLVYYRGKGILALRDDFYNVTKFLVINAFIGWILSVIFPFLFFGIGWSYGYRSFMGIFNVANSAGLLPFLYRNCGLLWEPGILQYFVNLFFLLSIIRNKVTLIRSAFVIIVLLSCNSSTGYVAFAILMTYYFFIYQKISFKYLIIGSICSVFMFGIIQNDLNEKFFGAKSTSGAARARDGAIGYDLISDKPIVGHGFFNEDYLLKHSNVAQIEDDFFSEQFLEENGLMAGGYTSGLLTVFITLGIPLALFLFYSIFNSCLIEGFASKFMFFSIYVLVLVGEPISMTPLFYFFVLSGLLKGINEISNVKSLVYN